VMSIYEDPAHPYTKALLESIPRVDMKGTQLAAIEGLPPNLTMLPPGCSFHPRCGFRKDNCSVDVPPLYDVAPGRRSACHYYEEVLDS
jgi:oligopeptide transport system ATP-binding protein